MLPPRQVTYQAGEDDQTGTFNEVDDWYFPDFE
jgi:hypothetical protein